MALVSLSLKPSTKQLHSFSFIFSLTGIVLGLLLYTSNTISLTWFLILSLSCFVFYCLNRVSTKISKPIYLAIVIVTFPIALFISYLSMTLFYFGIITPISVIFRVVGRDTLCRKYDRRAKTYWITHKNKKSIKEYFHQF